MVEEESTVPDSLPNMVNDANVDIELPPKGSKTGTTFIALLKEIILPFKSLSKFSDESVGFLEDGGGDDARIEKAQVEAPYIEV